MEQFNPEEIITSQRRLLEYNAKDPDLLRGINKAIEDSKVLKSKNDEESRKREKYWKRGTDPALLEKIHPKKAKTVNNRIWTNILTILPYWINRTPEPTPIASGLKNDQRERIIKSLQIAWEVNDDMKGKMIRAALHWLIYHIGVLKLRWDNKRKGIKTDNVLPLKIGFDPRATSLNNCEYIWEVLEDSVENLVKKFPGAQKKLYALVHGEKNAKSKVQYIEFWGGGGKWVVWKIQNKILDKMKNPNFDYENPDNNIFKEPRFPYLFLNGVFNLGYSLYDDTGLIDQAMPLQDSASKLERQILDLNEGQKRVWLASGEAISREDFKEVINETGDFGVYFNRKIPQGGLQLPLAGKPDASLFNDLEHLLGEIDNVMGVHAALRGQYTPGMSHLGMRGYAMMINQDLAKDLIVSRIEQLAEDWFNMYLHMIKVYGESDIEFSSSEESVILTKDDLVPGLRIMVKKGSMLPVDRASRADMATKLAGLGVIAPVDLYNDLGYGDTERRLRNLQEYQQGQIIPTDQTQEGQQLARLKKMMTGPQFQQLPDNEKLAIIQQAKQIVQGIKSKGQLVNQGGTI